MSFECKHYLNGHCVLREKECVPGDKGCVLNKAKVRFIDTGTDNAPGKDGSKVQEGEEGKQG